ncbi:inorganic diphosphatase [Nocardia sp. R6R-6]|uniref:inorganic diphosphatase n=1 Tax=Nocardia sp. R6R-6 TaxID=3459303 RepID=UPI00403D850D
MNLTFDRPYGSHHPTCGFRYLANYGYVPGTLAPDSKELDAYYLGPAEPLTSAHGICIAIVHRWHDDDDKLIVILRRTKALPALRRTPARHRWPSGERGDPTPASRPPNRRRD